MTELEDWYRVSFQQLAKTPLSATARQWGSLKAVLQGAYPHHTWDSHKFGLARKKSRQGVVVAILRSLFRQRGTRPYENLIYSS